MNENKGIRKNSMKRLTKSIFAVSIVSLMIGCGGQVALKKGSLDTIQSVSVSKNIAKPDRLSYQGRKESGLMGACGCLGGLFAGSTSKKTAVKITAVMEREEIDVTEIVREQFIEQLEESNLFNSIAPENSTAEFELSIRIYGFAQPQGLSSQLKPMLGVVGSLVRSDGSVLWKEYEYISNLSGKTPSHSLKEYLNNPTLIREAFTIAAQRVAVDLIEHLKE